MESEYNYDDAMSGGVAEEVSSRNAISSILSETSSNTEKPDATLKKVMRQVSASQGARRLESKQLIELLGETLEGVSVRRGQTFSGLGLVVYRCDAFSHKSHSDLRPSLPCPKGVLLGTEQGIEALLSISRRENPLHDGFMFFNDAGIMTHASQYFSPRITSSVVPNEDFGSRFRTAQYGSLLRGVVAVGVVEHEGERFVFAKSRSTRVKT